MLSRAVQKLCWFLSIAMLLAVVDDVQGEIRVKALSFNIRYGKADDGDNSWPMRKAMVFGIIKSSGADFCGLQEALRFQLDEVHGAVGGYGECGVGRDDGKTKGEYSPILFRKDRWKLDRCETRWLSDTPLVPNSTDWGNKISRIVTWARFTEQSSGKVVFVFNTHFDHQSQPSREKSGQALARLIAREADGRSIVVMGDLNAGEHNSAVTALKGGSIPLVDTFRVIQPTAQRVGTFNGFAGRTDGEKIDYIFVPASATVTAAAIDHTNTDSRYPSDHFPVSAEVLFPER